MNTNIMNINILKLSKKIQIMKKQFLMLVLSGLTLQALAQNKVETVTIKAGINCDHCKQCESCGKRLENAVYTEKGIKRVDVDEKTKTIKIVYNTGKTSPAKIREAISKVGYDADDVKADPAAYARLDECCKKQ